MTANVPLDLDLSEEQSSSRTSPGTPTAAIQSLLSSWPSTTANTTATWLADKPSVRPLPEPSLRRPGATCAGPN